MQTVKDVTGEEPPACPWRAFQKGVVLDVLELHRTVGPDGSPALLLAEDPPNHVWQGLLLYRDVLNRVRAHYEDLDREEAEQKRRLGVTNGK